MTTDYQIFPIRSAAILTGSYVAGTVLSPFISAPAHRNQLNVMVQFTIGSLTSAQIKVEFSHDGTTYFQDTFATISGATATMVNGDYSLASTGNYVISIPINFNYIKISAKGTGTATASSMTLDAIVGVT